MLMARKLSELKASETEKIDRYKERFNKWHAKQIDLLTFTINLIFTISIAFLGFIINMSNSRCPSLKGSIFIVLGITITLGILALITRLNDFRITKNITKSRRWIYELENDIQNENIKSSNKDRVKELLKSQKSWTRNLGYATWTLFYLQIGSLLAALWILISTM
jgi:hypothetical protein